MRLRLKCGLVFFACLPALGGCGSGAIKAYEGPERPKRDLAIVQGKYDRDDSPVASDVQIGAIDGVRYPPGKYEARMLPGPRRVVLRNSIRSGNRKRSYFCAFDLTTLPGCSYAPHPPNPASAGSGAGEDWRVEVAIPVTISCTDAAFAIRAPGQCSSDFPERPEP